jgi:hypothetical protein
MRPVDHLTCWRGRDPAQRGGAPEGDDTIRKTGTNASRVRIGIGDPSHGSATRSTSPRGC